MSAAIDALKAALADRYDLVRELGRGGMATVYLARDVRHARQVAIKVLHPELAAVLGAERFLAEIKTTANLQHPHILPLFDSGSADGQLFYVMPFVEGETLRARLDRETQLPIADAVQLAREVADALQYAHERGVIHRDIKPENILLQGGHALVADFGIALAVQQAGGQRMTQTGLSLGTPQYMAPEQAMGEKAVDARADIYAIGAVTYEMLAGEPPFTGPTPQAIMAKVMTSAPAALTSLRAKVPPHVEAAIQHALEKVPADRFASASLFSNALNSANADQGGPTSFTRSAAAKVGLSWRTTVAAVAVAIAGTALGARVLSTRASTAPDVIRFTLTTEPNQPMNLNPGKTFALSPDGRSLAYASRDSNGHAYLFVRSFDTYSVRTVTGSRDANSPFYSPEGDWLGFDDGTALKKIPFAGGTPTTLATGRVIGAMWGARGIVASIDNHLVLVPAEGGAPKHLVPNDSVEGEWPAWLPNGDAVIFSPTVRPGTSLAVLTLRDGLVRRLGVIGAYTLGLVDGELVYALSDGTLMAVPFDASSLQTTGAARAVVGQAQSNNLAELRAALSSSGTLAFIEGSARVELVLTDLNGAQRPLPIPSGALGSARYSPDGRRIVADILTGITRDIVVYDVASGASRRLTSDGGNNRPEWSPDGTRVLYRKSRDNALLSLWWRPVDSNDPEELLLSVPDKPIWQGVITPDGRGIVYRTGLTQQQDIWYRALSGDTTPRGIATSKFNESGPRVSPDSRWVAYQSDESGGGAVLQIFVRAIDGSGAPIPITIDGGSSPKWSHDGRTLFYLHNNAIYAASVSTAPTFVVGERRRLFDRGPISGFAGDFDVAPDDRSLLMTRTSGNYREEIKVIVNWAAELKASRPKQ